MATASNGKTIWFKGACPHDCPDTCATLTEVETRLRASKKFERVEVLKRFASITDPTQVAAANGSASNGNALAFGNLRGATGTEAGWTQFVASQSQQVTAANALDSAATARFTGTSQARDNISAVDLDKEAGDLIRYQQAYDAAARILQVARETMQSIFNAF